MSYSTTLSGSMMDNGQDALDHSSFLVSQALLADENYFDLSDLLQVPNHYQPTVSGRLGFDYPSLADPKIGLSSVSEVGNVKKVPLPAELVEQFGHMQCNCIMGLFPEINRAWLSIDSDIFVWNYEDGSDLAYFDGLSETILSAALIKPRAGIFQPHIQYLLCLTTPLDIVLLGVSFAVAGQGTGCTVQNEMHLLPEPLFSLPAENVQFLHVTGSKNGRIFMAGKDGCLYELVYQAEDGWFSRKCRKVNHSTSKLSFMLPSFMNFSFVEDDPMVQIVVDDSRNILYTRSEKGSIQVFDLCHDGQGMSRVAAMSQQTCVQNAVAVSKTIDAGNFHPIVSISAVSKYESSNIHLVAITQSGIRFYFTTNHLKRRGRPSLLSLVHVRLPPGFSVQSMVEKPSKIHCAHYSQGLALMSASQSEEHDVLWVLSSDSFPFQKCLRETFECLPMEGRTWALMEIPDTKDNKLCLNPSKEILPPSVVTQHIQRERRFVLINSQGSYVIDKVRVVDQLSELLLRHGPDSEQVLCFFQLHRDQACATCLLLACSQEHIQQRVAEMATRAFFKYGGERTYNTGVSAASVGPDNTTGASFLGMSNVQSSGSFMQPGQGLQPYQASTPLPGVQRQLFANGTECSAAGLPDIVFTWRHSGLCLYLGRILRSLWECNMVKEFRPPQGKKVYLQSCFSADEISFVVKNLNSLRDFMNRNSQFASCIMAEAYTTAHVHHHPDMSTRPELVSEEQMRRKHQNEAESQESGSLHRLQVFVKRCSECLALWRILSDHQFHVIADRLSKDQQHNLQHLTLKSFVSSGKELSGYLITSLINMYLDDNAATDAISERLREVCPSLYSMEDAVCSKGNEKLQAAKNVENLAAREEQLQESLEMYKQIATQIDLPVVCNQFGQARFYRGIVDLALTAAGKRDPQRLALHYYRNGEPPEDTQGIYAYNARMDCYKCITETLDFLLSTSMCHPQTPNVPQSAGPPPALQQNWLSNTDAEKYAEEVFNLVLMSDDEMFHISLYQWLIVKNMPEKLLEVQSPYLEPFLKRASQMYPDEIAHFDLLWKYYEKTKNYSSASKILVKLADRTSIALTLTQRMEYLSRAAICAKSSTMKTAAETEGEFLHELEEKMEVARIQLQVYEGLSQKKSVPGVEEAMARLNSQLMDITALYGEFADQYELPECKLAIIHCAGHYDPTLVETLWQDIVVKELRSSADKNTLMTTLSHKLVKLGRMYGASERYFPIGFLIQYLEQVSCQQDLDAVNSMFVCRVMQDVGVTIPKLHETYDRLFKSKNSCWKMLRKPHHLLNVIHDLLDCFASNPNSVPGYERRLFKNVCLDAVANYLVELHAESSFTENVSQLKIKFKDLQAKLDRIV